MPFPKILIIRPENQCFPVGKHWKMFPGYLLCDQVTMVITLTIDPDPRRGQHRRGVKHRVDVDPFKDLVYS